MLSAIEETALWTTAKIAGIRELAEHTRLYIERRRRKFYSYELANLIFELPYCRIANLVERGIAKRQTASIYLKELVEIDVLVERKVNREKLFVHPKFLRLLTHESNRFDRYPEVW